MGFGLVLGHFSNNAGRQRTRNSRGNESRTHIPYVLCAIGSHRFNHVSVKTQTPANYRPLEGICVNALTAVLPAANLSSFFRPPGALVGAARVSVHGLRCSLG